MWTIGRDNGRVVIFSDQIEQCGGFARLSVDVEGGDAESLVRQLAFLLGLSIPLATLPAPNFQYAQAQAAASERSIRLVDTIPAPARVPLPPALEAALAETGDPAEEARLADAAVIAARRAHEAKMAAAVQEREMRRAMKTGGKDE